jgi:hypothetical protein
MVSCALPTKNARGSPVREELAHSSTTRADALAHVHVQGRLFLSTRGSQLIAASPRCLSAGFLLHCVYMLAVVSTYVMLSVLFFLVHPRCSCAPDSSLGPAGGRPARGVPKGWTPSKGQGTSRRPRSGEGWGCHREPRVWLGGKVRHCGVWDSANLCRMPPG